MEEEEEDDDFSDRPILLAKLRRIPGISILITSLSSNIFPLFVFLEFTLRKITIIAA